MAGLIDFATAILSSAERRLEATAQNVANASTAGFKRQASFSQLLEGANASGTGTSDTESFVDFSQGRLTETGNPLDLAIQGPGLFQLRDGERIVYARGGSFTRGEGGLLADAAGRVLQLAGGGDLSLGDASFEVLSDGTVLEDGLPTARLGLFEAPEPGALTAVGGSAFAAEPAQLDEAASSEIRQGFTEKSNVVMSDEMVAMMATLRRAESGGRLVQFYDEMVGQAINTFSRSGK